MKLKDLYNEVKLIKSQLAIFNSLKLGKEYLIDINIDVFKTPLIVKAKLMNKYKTKDNDQNEILIIEFLVPNKPKYYSRMTYSNSEKNKEKHIYIEEKIYMNSINTFLTIKPIND